MYGENCPRKAFMRILYGDTMRCHSDWLWKKQEFNQNTHAIQMRAYSNGRRLIVFGCMKDPLHTRRDPYTLFRHGKWEIPHVRIGLMCMQSKRKGSKTRNQTTIRIFPFDRERSRNHLRWAPKPPKEKSVPIFEPASESSEIHYTLNVEWETIYIGTPCRGFGFSFFFSFVWRRKFCDMFKIYEAQTESVPGKKHTVSDFLQLLRLLSLILTLSPLVWLRIYSSSSKQSTNSNLRQRHAFILLSLFRTSLHILDCNSRLSALIMRRHIRYIQFILTTIYCTEITISQFKDGGRKELMAIAEMVKKMPIA